MLSIKQRKELDSKETHLITQLEYPFAFGPDISIQNSPFDPGFRYFSQQKFHIDRIPNTIVWFNCCVLILNGGRFQFSGWHFNKFIANINAKTFNNWRFIVIHHVENINNSLFPFVCARCGMSNDISSLVFSALFINNLKKC